MLGPLADKFVLNMRKPGNAILRGAGELCQDVLRTGVKTLRSFEIRYSSFLKLRQLDVSAIAALRSVIA